MHLRSQGVPKSFAKHLLDECVTHDNIAQLTTEVRHIQQAYPGMPSQKLELVRATGWANPKKHATSNNLLAILSRSKLSNTASRTLSTSSPDTFSALLSHHSGHVVCSRTEVLSKYHPPSPAAVQVERPKFHGSSHWRAPAHAVAPLAGSLGERLQHRPHGFNDPASNATLPNATQAGATCGLHAYIHLLEGLRLHRKPRIQVPTRATFEARGLDAQIGDRLPNLVQPGGRNYDIAIIHANFQYNCAQCFPMTLADLEGNAMQSGVI